MAKSVLSLCEECGDSVILNLCGLPRPDEIGTRNDKRSVRELTRRRKVQDIEPEFLLAVPVVNFQAIDDVDEGG